MMAGLRSIVRALGAVMVLLPATASATEVPGAFFTKGIWSVVPVDTACLAVNRPLGEAMNSPYNSLFFAGPKTGGLEFQVVFWPGYLEKGAKYTLIVGTTKGRLEVPVKPLPFLPDRAVTVQLEDGDELSSLLLTTQEIAVALKEKPESLTFGTSDLPAVLQQLEACAAQLRAK